MPIRHTPISLSLRTTTRDGLREAASRLHTNTSKIADQAIAEHLRYLDAAVNGKPAKVIFKKLDPADNPLRKHVAPRPTIDASIGHRQRAGLAPAGFPPQPPPPPPTRNLGAAVVVFPEPLDEAMAEQLERTINRELALLIAEATS